MRGYTWRCLAHMMRSAPGSCGCATWTATRSLLRGARWTCSWWVGGGRGARRPPSSLPPAHLPSPPPPLPSLPHPPLPLLPLQVKAKDVGLPHQLKVWHDNSGRTPDWFLDYIRIRKKAGKVWALFPCSRWFSTHLDDCRISRVLLTGHSTPLIQYKVWGGLGRVCGGGEGRGVQPGSCFELLLHQAVKSVSGDASPPISHSPER